MNTHGNGTGFKHSEEFGFVLDLLLDAPQEGVLLICGLAGVGLRLHLMVITAIRCLGQRSSLKVDNICEGLTMILSTTAQRDANRGRTTTCDILQAGKDA